MGAYGGRDELMAHVAPEGQVYQAGTLSGNPLAMAAGIAALKALQRPGVYDTLESRSSRLAEGLAAAAEQAGIPAVFNRVGSMLGMFFTDRPVNDFDDAKTCDLDQFACYYQGMLAEGIYLAPSQFEAGFVSLAHSEEAIDRTIAAASRVLGRLA